MLFGQCMIKMPRNIHNFPQGWQPYFHLWVLFHTRIYSLFIMEAHLDCLSCPFHFYSYCPLKNNIFPIFFFTFRAGFIRYITGYIGVCAFFIFVKVLWSVIFGSMDYPGVLFGWGDITTMKCITLPDIWWFICTCWIVQIQGFICTHIELLLLELLQCKSSPAKLYELELWF